MLPGLGVTTNFQVRLTCGARMNSCAGPNWCFWLSGGATRRPAKGARLLLGLASLAPQSPRLAAQKGGGSLSIQCKIESRAISPDARLAVGPPAGLNAPPALATAVHESLPPTSRAISSHRFHGRAQVFRGKHMQREIQSLDAIQHRESRQATKRRR